MGVTRKFLNWYARIAPAYGKSNPPYEHVVQIGDPRLRNVADLVPLDKIKTTEIQTIIKKLEHVTKKYGSLGMSAPQIGINTRIFVMSHTLKQLSRVPKAISQLQGMEIIPFTLITKLGEALMEYLPALQDLWIFFKKVVFINPKLKVIDYQKVTYREGCESVQGYTAEVPRYKAVEIAGHNEQGEATTKVFKNWAARIAQHEMDHLDGKLYTDTMDRKTLTCTCWEEVNLSKGKLVIPFSPH